MNMSVKNIAGDVWTHSKRGLSIAAKDVLLAVVIPKVVDPLLDKLKGIIPTKLDDALIEAFRPQLKEMLIELSGKIYEEKV